MSVDHIGNNMSLKRNAVANYLGQAWVAIMGVAFVPLYIRHLGMEAWGLVGFMAMLQAWLTVLDLGLTPTLSREMARFTAGAHGRQEIRDLLRSLELFYGLAAVVVMLAVWFAAPWLASRWLNAKHVSPETIGTTLGVISFVLASRMVEQVYRGAIQGLQRQVWLNAAQSVMASVRWGGAALVVLLTSDIASFFLWQAFASALTVLWLASETYRLLPQAERRARFSWPAIKEVWRFAAGMAITTVLSLLLTQVDKLLLSRLVSLESFGYYALAGSVAAMLGYVGGPMASAVFPRMSELVTKREQQALVELYHKASQWCAAILFPVGLMFAGFAEPLLMVWTGDAGVASRTAPLLSVLALGSLCHGLMLVPYMAQLAHGLSGIAVKMNVIAVLVIVPGILWAVPQYGPMGAAWGWFLLNAGYVSLGVLYTHSRLLKGEAWRWYRDALGRPLLAGGATLLVLSKAFAAPVDRIDAAVFLLAMGILMLAVTLCTTPVSWHYVRGRSMFRWPGGSLPPLRHAWKMAHLQLATMPGSFGSVACLTIRKQSNARGREFHRHTTGP